MKYLHKFNSAAEFEAAYNGNDYIEPWVSITPVQFKWMLDGSEFVVEFKETASVSINDDPNYVHVMQNCLIWEDVASGNLYATNKQPEDGDPVVKLTATPEDDYPYTSTDLVGLNNTTLFLTSSEDLFRVDYNKQPVVEEYDIEIDCDGHGECSGQEILSMSSRVGPYQIIEDSGYMYTVTNSNLTTNPLQTLKVKVVNGPNNSDGVYECTYFDNDGAHGWEYSISDDPFMAVRVDVFNNDGAWQLQAYLTEGC